MTSKRKLAGRIFGLLSLIVMVACTGQSGEPTPDANAIFTAAAQTVAAQLTQTAAAQPTATFTQAPTNTTEPTKPATTITLPALPAPGTTLSVPGATLPALATTAPLPGLATATRPVSGGPDKCTWDRNDPADGAVIDPNREFDLTYYIRNTGTSTWTKQYKLRYYVGDYFVQGREFNLLEETAPNQIGRAVADAKAPSSAGTYKATFVITNTEGVNFCILDFTFKVGSSAEATNAPTATSIDLATICQDSGHSGSYDTECNNFCPTFCTSNPGKKCYVAGTNKCP